MTAHIKELKDKIDETVDLLDDMASELTSLGCEEPQLLDRVSDLREWLKHYEHWKDLELNQDPSKTVIH